MNICVTGANGLIGNFLYKKYKESGHNVVGVDNFSNSPYRDSDIINGDCANLELMNDVLKNVDTIFHCACSPYEGLSNFSPRAITFSVFVPSVTVATAAVNNGVKRIYNFSSMARYGRQKCDKNKPFTELTQTMPCDPYGNAKVAAENNFNIMSEIYGFEVVHLVPHNVFGCGVRWDDMRRGVINIFITQALRGQRMSIHNDGEQKRSFSFVEDAFSFADQLLECDIENKEIFNVGPNLLEH